MSVSFYLQEGTLPESLSVFLQDLFEATRQRDQAYVEARLRETMTLTPPVNPHPMEHLAPVIVVNKYKLAEQCPLSYQVVEIGRPSVLGNPFKLGDPYTDGRPGVYQRGEAVVDHETWFRTQMRDADSPVRVEVMRLAQLVAQGQGLALCCYCKPKPCHGDVLAKAIIAYAQQISEKTA
jgi:hypothetical protein